MMIYLELYYMKDMKNHYLVIFKNKILFLKLQLFYNNFLVFLFF